jgi:hypothetical protein
MPQVLTEPYLQLALTVDTDVIREFDLTDIVINTYKVNHLTIYHRFDLLDEETVNFPFTFPPKFETHSKEYLDGFLILYNKLVDGIDEKHHDNLLFLAYSYFKSSDRKGLASGRDAYLRKKGQLLRDLIKVPIPILNKSNIYEAFADDPDLSKDDIKQHILAYLSLVSDKQEQEFLKDPDDPESEINFRKIDKPLWIKLTKRIQIDRQVSILINDPVDEKEIEGLTDIKKIKELDAKKKYLTVSRDINLSFKPIKGKKKEVKEVAINKQLLSLVIKELFEEQKRHRTNLYYVLLDHDFIFNTDFKLLSSAVGDYDRSCQHYSNLEELYNSLYQYLDKDSLLKVLSVQTTKRKRTNFIFQYFLLLNLISNTNTKAKPRHKDDLDYTRAEVDKFKERNRQNRLYATKILADAFKNNNREKEKYQKDKKVKV